MKHRFEIGELVRVTPEWWARVDIVRIQKQGTATKKDRHGRDIWAYNSYVATDVWGDVRYFLEKDLASNKTA